MATTVNSAILQNKFLIRLIMKFSRHANLMNSRLEGAHAYFEGTNVDVKIMYRFGSQFMTVAWLVEMCNFLLQHKGVVTTRKVLPPVDPYQDSYTNDLSDLYICVIDKRSIICPKKNFFLLFLDRPTLPARVANRT